MIQTCIHTCINTYIYIYTCIYSYVFAHTCKPHIPDGVRIALSRWTRLQNMYMHMYIHMYVNVTHIPYYTHIYIFLHIYISFYTHISLSTRIYLKMFKELFFYWLFYELYRTLIWYKQLKHMYIHIHVNMTHISFHTHIPDGVQRALFLLTRLPRRSQERRSTLTHADNLSPIRIYIHTYIYIYIYIHMHRRSQERRSTSAHADSLSPTYGEDQDKS
jgi:hypothetical protein